MVSRLAKTNDFNIFCSCPRENYLLVGSLTLMIYRKKQNAINGNAGRVDLLRKIVSYNTTSGSGALKSVQEDAWPLRITLCICHLKKLSTKFKNFPSILVHLMSYNKPLIQTLTHALEISSETPLTSKLGMVLRTLQIS